MGFGSKIKRAVSKAADVVVAPVKKVVAPVLDPVRKVTSPGSRFVNKGFRGARSDLSRGFAGGKDQLRTGVGLLSHRTGIPSAFSSPSSPAPEEDAPQPAPLAGYKTDPYRSPPIIAAPPVVKVSDPIGAGDPINAGLPATAFPTDNGAGTFASFLSTYASPPSTQGGQLPPSAFAQVDDAPAVAGEPTGGGFPLMLIVALVAGAAIVAAVLVLKR